MAEAQETSDYPGSLDTWVTLTNKEDLAEQSDINKIKAAIEAVQTEIGTDPAGTLATLKARLAIALHTNGALAQGTSFPVSPTPVEGQEFYRTDLNGFYIYDGADWIAIGTGGMQLFTSNGTYTAPSGAYVAVVTAVGGGGGGAKHSSTAGGGGGGGAIIGCVYPTIPGNNYTVVVGSGGAGKTGSDGSGSAGGASTFDTNISASGGAGGTSSGGGAGGSVSTLASLNAPSATGGTTTAKHKAAALIDGGNGAASPGGSVGGGGGASAYGNGGNGGTTSPTEGSEYGGGGGGGSSLGANGAQGFVLVMY